MLTNLQYSTLKIEEKVLQEKIAVIIPCYRVKNHIFSVLSRIPDSVSFIIVVDDFCPEKTGALVRSKYLDPRLTVLFNPRNLGVGGATKAGFEKATQLGADILVKLDGDGQMDPLLIEKIVRPIAGGVSDYAKGNRFFSSKGLKQMPFLRLLGNSGLSFLTKLSSGYWHIMDPTNGFIAISSKAYRELDTSKVDNRFFFETDLLCALRRLGAVVQDVPLIAKYGDEKSNLKIGREVVPFAVKHLKRMFKRMIYEYFVADFNVGSAQILFGSLSFILGSGLGVYLLLHSLYTQMPSKTGWIMFSSLTLILGFQLLLSALNYDISKRNREPISPLL